MNVKQTELSQILEELRTRLQDIYGDDLREIILYGSEARGTASADSDIDIAVVLRHPVSPGQEIARLGDMLADLNLRYQRLISIIPTDVEIYRSSEDPLWRNVRLEGIAVYFAKTGLLKNQHHRALLKAFNRRQLGGYSTSSGLTQADINDMHQEAEEFLADAKRWLEEHAGPMAQI